MSFSDVFPTEATRSFFDRPATPEQRMEIIALGGRPTRHALSEAQARKAISELRRRARERDRRVAA
jgi:hypothetical protein